MLDVEIPGAQKQIDKLLARKTKLQQQMQLIDNDVKRLEKEIFNARGKSPLRAGVWETIKGFLETGRALSVENLYGNYYLAYNNGPEPCGASQIDYIVKLLPEEFDYIQAYWETVKVWPYRG